MSNFYLNNEGKTAAALIALTGLRVYTPTDSARFPLQGLDPSVHQAILWDDFRWMEDHRRMMLAMTGGMPFTADNKHEAPVLMMWHKPIIFTSNFAPIDDPFRVRLRVLKFTDRSAFEEEICPVDD